MKPVNKHTIPMFLTRLLVSPVANGRLWMTEYPFVVKSKIVGIIEIPAGFLFDGNSVPRLSWMVSPPTDFLEAGCVHDFLYRHGECDRKVADQVYEEVLGAMGMTKGRRKFRYGMLRALGSFAFKKARASTSQTAS